MQLKSCGQVELTSLGSLGRVSPRKAEKVTASVRLKLLTSIERTLFM